MPFHYSSAIKPQSERLYRRTVEEFNRLKSLGPELLNEPILETQPEENEPPCAPSDEPGGTCFSLFVPGAERPSAAPSGSEPVDPIAPQDADTILYEPLRPSTLEM
jgi:hypothetical protein